MQIFSAIALPLHAPYNGVFGLSVSTNSMQNEMFLAARQEELAVASIHCGGTSGAHENQEALHQEGRPN
jgi:hypothetical protein